MQSNTENIQKVVKIFLSSFNCMIPLEVVDCCPVPNNKLAPELIVCS